MERQLAAREEAWKEPKQAECKWIWSEAGNRVRGVQCWHKQDTTFQRPKGIIHVDLSTPTAYTSPTAAVSCTLFTKMVEDSLNEYAYNAEIAGLSYRLFNTTE